MDAVPHFLPARCCWKRWRILVLGLLSASMGVTLKPGQGFTTLRSVIAIDHVRKGRLLQHPMRSKGFRLRGGWTWLRRHLTFYWVFHPQVCPPSSQVKCSRISVGLSYHSKAAFPCFLANLVGVSLTFFLCFNFYFRRSSSISSAPEYWGSLTQPCHPPFISILASILSVLLVSPKPNRDMISHCCDSFAEFSWFCHRIV